MSLYPENVPFTIVQEKWCSYDVGDGSILRTKLTLQKIVKPADIPLEKVPALNFNTHAHLIIYTKLSKKGTPETKKLTPEFLQESIVEDIDPKPLQTFQNEYLLKNGTTIKLNLMLTRVAKTDIFSADGCPVFMVNTQVVPSIQFPKRRKPRRKNKGVV